MLRSTQNITAKKLFRMYQNDELDFNLNVQRGIVWDDKRKSLFIDSLINDYPVPMFFSVKIDDVLHFLDGQQRMHSVFEFISDNFRGKDFVIDNQNYGDCYFSELPQDVREDIEGYSFSVCEVTPRNDTELEEVFIRLNNGIALTPFELTRSRAGKKVISVITEITKKAFFTKIPFSDRERKRHLDEETVLIAMGLISGGLVSTGSTSIRRYANIIKHEGIKEDMRERMGNIADYLSKMTFDPFVLHKIRTRINLPVILTAVDKTDISIDPALFQRIATTFFAHPPFDYRMAASSTNSANSVKIRVETFLEALNDKTYR